MNSIERQKSETIFSQSVWEESLKWKKGFECKRNNYEHSILNVPLGWARGRRN